MKNSKSVDVMSLMTPEERTAAVLFNEAIESGGGHELKKAQLQRLIKRGLIRNTGRGYYEQTETMLEIEDLLASSVGMNKSNTVYEHELKANVERGAVSIMNIKEVMEGKYRVSVILSWRSGEVILVTQKNHPRLWANLETLARHIKKHYRGDEIPIINLQLKRS